MNKFFRITGTVSIVGFIIGVVLLFSTGESTEEMPAQLQNENLAFAIIGSSLILAIISFFLAEKFREIEYVKE